MARAALNSTYRRDNRLIQSKTRWFWLVVLVAGLLYLPDVLVNREIFGISVTNTQLLGVGLTQINTTLIMMIAAIALNVLTGYTGLISVGNAGFFALGAGVGAFLGMQHQVPFLLILVFSAISGALVGVIVGVPSLRVRGLYLLLATLAFQQIANWVFLRYQKANYGEVGVLFTPPNLIGDFALDTDKRWFYFLIVLVAFTVIGSLNLLRSREGRALVAIRDQDIAAASAGINVPMVKLKVFGLTSAVITVAGTLYAYYLGVAEAGIYSIAFAIQFVAIIIIGGLGSITGAVLGTLVLELLPQVIDTTSKAIGEDAPLIGGLLADYPAQVNDIVLGLVIILIVIFKPGGLNAIWLSLKRFFLRWPYTS
jgi:branched-chain amino acid transport system permease protein